MSQDPASIPAASGATEEVVIRPRGPWTWHELSQLVAYRDLLVLLVRRDFVSKYRQTVLGPLWFFVNPLVTAAIFTVVFHRVIGVETDGVPPMLFYLAGMLWWGYFSTVLGATANSLGGNAGLFSKVYFPRLVPPIASTVSALFALGIQFATFLGYFAVARGTGATLPGVGATWFFLPLLVVHAAALALGVGLLLSCATAKYRDLQHVLPFLTQAWLYATPVIYPLSKLPESARPWAALNPLVPIVEAGRLVLLGAGSVTAGAYVLSVALTVVLLAAGVVLYQRSSRTFVDIV